MLGLVSLMQVQQYVKDQWTETRSWLVVLGVLSLGSYGVYIGRFLRWNSWDILLQPKSLFLSLIQPMLNPVEFKATIGIVVVLTCFLLLCYWFLQILIGNQKIKKS